jgi:hypothetical protein
MQTSFSPGLATVLYYFVAIPITVALGILILLVILLTLALPVHAEVFKCTTSEFNIVYQAQPCAGAVNGQKIEIKQRSAEEEAAAVSNLKAWEASYAAEQATKKEALKAEQKDMLRRAEVEIAQRKMLWRNMVTRSRKTGRRGSWKNANRIRLPYRYR